MTEPTLAVAARAEPRQKVLMLCAMGLTGLVAIADLFAMVNLNAITMILFVGAQGMLCVSVLLYLILVIRTRESIARKRFAPGKVIFNQGDIGRELYIIVEGQVEIEKEGRGDERARIARLGPGEFFGEMALIEQAPRVATARAASSLEVLVLTRSTFGALFTYLPDLRQSFNDVMKKRRQELEKIARAVN